MDKNRSYWNQQQQALRITLTHPDKFNQAISLFIKQHAMVHSADMSGLGLLSFEDEIWQGLDDNILRKIPGNEEHSILWIFWHITRIEDITTLLSSLRRSAGRCCPVPICPPLYLAA
jgi:hypothetical protein